MKRDLVIFAKYPEPGRVKTRLARTIGEGRAVALYKEMVETVVRRTTPIGSEYRQVLCFDPPGRRGDFQRWFPDLELSPQVSGDLGRRMEAAFRGSFADRIVIIGSDCPDVDRDLIVEAFQKLEKSDVVIGPATDGGYYLIGLKKEEPDLFRDIAWSTGRVLEQTKDRAQGLHLRVKTLPILSDLDEIR